LQVIVDGKPPSPKWRRSEVIPSQERKAQRPLPGAAGS
jgi:hypothetical protein